MPERMSNDAELELRDYLGVLWRRKRFVFLALLLLVTAALGLSYVQTPVYQSTAEFSLRPITSQLGGNTGKGADPVQNAIGELKSERVRTRIRDLKGVAPRVSATAVPGTGLIRATVESTDPRQAADLANAYVDEYINFRVGEAIRRLDDESKLHQERFNRSQARLNEINIRLASFILPSARQAEEIRVGAERNQLESEASDARQQLDALNQEKARVRTEAEKTEDARVPKDPVRPKPARNAALAIPIGLVIGVALAFLFEHLDDSLKSKEDVERITGPTLPVVGVIPAVRMRDDAGSQLVSLVAPDSPVAEAYRTMRTSVQFLALDDSLGSIQITSPSAGEGKTTTLANLAVVMARAGAKVVVIDCDLRRPRLHEVFGVPNDIGFTSVFQGQVPLSGALQAIPGERNLRILPSGPLPPNPSELLGSRRTAGILASLKAQGALVLLDCPPIMPVTDAAALSAWVDTTIVVAAYGSTTKRQLQRAIELLRQVDAPLVGTVLNRAQGSESYGYSYGYYHRKAEPDARRRAPNGQELPARSATRTGG
ncbi:MAG: polysaccharide biosynthesis tyrosine autokinase [Acidimicrobiales bacterium]